MNNKHDIVEKIKREKIKNEARLERLRSYRELLEDSGDDTHSLDGQISFYENEIRISEDFIKRESA